MTADGKQGVSRRRLLIVAGAAPAVVGAYALTACGSQADAGRTTTAVATSASTPPAVQPTRACDDGGEPTVAQTEGPYFTPDSPRRRRLRSAATTGSRLVVSGLVVDTACKPIRHALLDFWQADGEGRYDNRGYDLRGHQFTGKEGRYELDTVLPGLYPGRTRHIHVKVQRPGGQVLTTQLYFPGVAENASDGIYSRDLEMGITRRADIRRGSFHFVLA